MGFIALRLKFSFPKAHFVIDGVLERAGSGLRKRMKGSVGKDIEFSHVSLFLGLKKGLGLTKNPDFLFFPRL